MRAAALALLLALPVAAADWNIDSNDTGPGNLVVYNDTWNAGRVTAAGDTIRLALTITTDQVGNATWRVPATVAGQDNPLHRLYERVDVHMDGVPIGSFGPQQPLSFRMGSITTEFALSIRVARAAGNATTPEMVSGWIALEGAAPQKQTSNSAVVVQESLSLGLVHRYLGVPRAGDIVVTEAVRIERPSDPASTWFDVGDVTLPLETHFDLCVTGGLTTATVEWFAGDQPLQMVVSGTGPPTVRPARTMPGQECIRVILPPGQYDIQMRTMGEFSTAEGSFTLRSLTDDTEHTGTLSVAAPTGHSMDAATVLALAGTTGLAATFVGVVWVRRGSHALYKVRRADGTEATACGRGGRAVVAMLADGAMRTIGGAPKLPTIKLAKLASCGTCPVRGVCWDAKKRLTSTGAPA